MARSSRLLSHSPARWKATPWKPKPLPPLEEAAPPPQQEAGLGCQSALQPSLAPGKADLREKATTAGRSYEALQLWLVLVTLGVSLAIAVGVALVKEKKTET